MADKKSGTYTYPFPRPSLTVDVAVVTVEPKPRLLLIQRKADPFAGKWALPGGFVDENEPLLDAARRELKEEAGLELMDFEQLHTFGDKGRDPRGWTVSVVYLSRVPPDELQADAGDDADAVEWFPLDRLPALAFDHATIVQRVRARLEDRAA